MIGFVSVLVLSLRTLLRDEPVIDVINFDFQVYTCVRVHAEEVLSLLTKIIDVQLPERKELVRDNEVAADEASDCLEDSFRKRVISEFPSLCADSLPHDEPVARQLDGSPFRVKLRLKEGVEPQGRRPYRIPESYRPEMEKTIAKLLEFKLIEPSISHYSNPVFLPDLSNDWATTT